MQDLDSYRTQRETRRDRAVPATSTRYSEAVNRYLGAVGYRVDEPVTPAVATKRPVAPAVATGVLVGVDDTPTSYTAVDHAAIEAELRGWDLRIVHVQPPGGLRQSSRDAGAHLLERLADRVHAYSPSVPVTCRLMVGAAAPLLLSHAGDAGLVVVGHRHSAVGVTFGLSVGDRVAAQHRGPVLVDGVRRTGVSADPMSALIDASGTAAAVVVGRHGTGAMARASLGSVSRALVQRAHCPVFLVG